MADDTPLDLTEELRRISHEFRRLHRAIYLMVEAAISHEQELEGAAIMAALDDLAALGTRIAAVTATLPTDIATAVAAQAAADKAAITTAQDALAAAQASAATAATELDAAISTLTGQVAALETAAGVQPPAAALTVTPSAATIAVGSTGNTPVAVNGGTGAISATDLPTGITYDGTGNLVADGTEVAGVSTVTFSDSSTPTPLTGTLALTVQ